MILDTVKVVDADSPLGYVIMNKSDFKPAEHQLHDAEPKTPASTPERLPAITKLEEHLAGMTDVDAITAMAARDDREKAAPLYEARLKALASAS